MTRRTAVMLPLLLLLQLALVAVGVWPQLSARATGDEVQLRVEPIDPIDPFRGAYVALDYPDLRHGDPEGFGGFEGGQGAMDDGGSGPVFVTLRRDGDLWEADDWTRDRPDGGTYLRCDDRSWQIRCGIESWFLPQDEARAMEDAVSAGEVVATVKVDARGNAALIDVTAPD
jgi:uncharacterized membrane-anchored protein